MISERDEERNEDGDEKRDDERDEERDEDGDEKRDDEREININRLLA